MTRHILKTGMDRGIPNTIRFGYCSIGLSSLLRPEGVSAKKFENYKQLENDLTDSFDLHPHILEGRRRMIAQEMILDVCGCGCDVCDVT
ncbi:hypothetical protein KIN20_008797 [Parelaphostrongylus tenuis]|uniref:Uncharacterized protein n=1 Tax=Parelaphostrongylus tenuis TaxID=148309 RepID=A0AAD5QK26_PARTN|nr:hypothetical protein KIN20_008797 [Parelaphostrongylus tenuis]